MCGRKPKYTPPAAPAPPPTVYDMNSLEGEESNRRRKRKGKRGLIIEAKGGTGINL